MLDDNNTTILDVVTTYDHDYRGVHVLCSVFTKEETEKNYHHKGYELWHIRVDNTYGRLGAWYDRELGNPPHAESGQIVQNWYNTYVLNQTEKG